MNNDWPREREDSPLFDEHGAYMVGMASKAIPVPVEGVEGIPRLLIFARSQSGAADVAMESVEYYLTSIQANQLLKDFGSVTPSAFNKAMATFSTPATSEEILRMKEYLRCPNNTARCSLVVFRPAASFLQAHSRDPIMMQRVVGTFKAIQPLNRSPLYTASTLAECFPPVLLITPDHRRRSLIAEGKEDANEAFGALIEETCTLFNKAVEDPRVYSQLAELRNKYGIAPTCYMAKRDRLRAMMISAVSALVGFLNVVYNLPAPESLIELFGMDGQHILEYTSLQLKVGQDQLEEASLLCGPTTLCNDLFAYSLLYQLDALKAIAEDRHSDCDRRMRIAATFHRLSKGVTQNVPVQVPHILVVDRFKDPLAAVARIETYLTETAALEGPLTSLAHALQVRDATVMGVLGSIAGGHRVSQVIGTVIKGIDSTAPAVTCPECTRVGCTGNRIFVHPDGVTVQFRLSHHKNQRADRGRAIRPLQCDFKSESLATVLKLYDQDARQILHDVYGNVSPYMFLTREGEEYNRRGKARWHLGIHSNRSAANHLVQQVSSRVLDITPGMSARDFRRLWIGVVNDVPGFAQESKSALYTLIGTSEKQVLRTYDVTIASRALESLASHVRRRVAEREGRLLGDIGDRFAEARFEGGRRVPAPVEEDEDEEEDRLRASDEEEEEDEEEEITLAPRAPTARTPQKRPPSRSAADEPRGAPAAALSPMGLMIRNMRQVRTERGDGRK